MDTEEDRKAEWVEYEEPWIRLLYSSTILNQTIATFDRLVQAIEDRLPSTASAVQDDRTIGVVDQGTLLTMHITKGFVYEFLTRVRRPRFKLLAPGLHVPTSLTFPTQPFDDVAHDDEYKSPVLLFGADQPAPNDAECAFPYPGDMPASYQAGLYLDQQDLPQDECVLVLPFRIGGNGLAARSDGFVIKLTRLSFGYIAVFC